MPVKTKFIAAERESSAPVFRMSGKELTPDRQGDRIMPGALRMPAGATDLPLYVEHAHQSFGSAMERLPVGRAKAWEVKGEWFMSPVFSDATEEARTCAALVADGTLKACSIGFLTEQATPNEFRGEDVHRAELVEVSIVGIPAKPEAVRVKSMDEETKKALAAMGADMAEMKAMVKAMHEKQFPPEPEDEEETKATTTEDPDADNGDAPPEPTEDDDEPAAKFFRSFRVKRSA